MGIEIKKIITCDICNQTCLENDNIIEVYPARVKFRGFNNDSTEKAYIKISKYMLDNAKELSEEANN